MSRWRLSSHHHYHRVHFLHCRRLTRRRSVQRWRFAESAPRCIKLSRDIFLFASKCLCKSAICCWCCVSVVEETASALRFPFSLPKERLPLRSFPIQFSHHFSAVCSFTLSLSDCASLCATRASNCACFVSAPAALQRCSASRCSCKEIFNSAMSCLVFGFFFFLFWFLWLWLLLLLLLLRLGWRKL